MFLNVLIASFIAMNIFLLEVAYIVVKARKKKIKDLSDKK